MVKTQIFFDSLKQEFVTINNKAEYVLQRQRDILQFHWPDDALFDKWMAEIAPGEQFDEDETDDDEVQDDEIQIIDTITTQAQQEEEDKNDQSLSIAGPSPQDANTTGEEGKEEVTLTIQDKDGENLQVEINLQSSEQISSLASLAVSYTENSEQRPKSTMFEGVTEADPPNFF